MSQQVNAVGRDRSLAEHFRVTREDVLERMADPFLTDHDRWVLGQFASFLGGRVPDPDPRVASLVAARQAPIRPLYGRVRRATL